MVDFVRIKKNINPWGVNQFVTQSISSAIEANKTAFSEGKPFSDACWQIVFCIDNVERVVKGVGIIKDNATDYDQLLNDFTVKMNETKFDSTNKSVDDAIRAVKVAQYKFQLLIEAVRTAEPSEFELSI